ncbi:hypothetical protein BDQ17DRAFT_1323574 [Cyathus striatus]|nr:hypothetical protein BDQ17DRAFT_1323574 [Cyathus striatus]
MYALTHTPFPPWRLCHNCTLSIFILKEINLSPAENDFWGDNMGAGLEVKMLEGGKCKTIWCISIVESVSAWFQLESRIPAKLAGLQLVKGFLVDSVWTGTRPELKKLAGLTAKMSPAGFYGLLRNSLKSVWIVHGIHGVWMESGWNGGASKYFRFIF